MIVNRLTLVFDLVIIILSIFILAYVPVTTIDILCIAGVILCCVLILISRWLSSVGEGVGDLTGNDDGGGDTLDK